MILLKKDTKLRKRTFGEIAQHHKEEFSSLLSKDPSIKCAKIEDNLMSIEIPDSRLKNVNVIYLPNDINLVPIDPDCEFLNDAVPHVQFPNVTWLEKSFNAYSLTPKLIIDKIKDISIALIEDDVNIILQKNVVSIKRQEIPEFGDIVFEITPNSYPFPPMILEVSVYNYHTIPPRQSWRIPPKQKYIANIDNEFKKKITTKISKTIM